MNSTSHYDFWRLVCFANMDPKSFCGRNRIVLMFQRRGIRKRDGSTPTTTISSRKEKEKKQQDRKRNLDMEHYISTRRDAQNKALVTKAPRVNDDALQLESAL